MSQTDERQAAREAWVSTVKDAWPSLGPDVQEHCASSSNLTRWWPGTRPCEAENELREKTEAR